MKYILIFLFSVFISSVSQIILKSSANDKHDSIWKDYLNIKVISAYFIFFLSSLITMYAYRYVELSTGPLLEAASYIFIAVLGYIFLKEKISKKRIIGLLCIMAGIFISCSGF